MKKVRVQFDLPEHKLRQFDELMALTGISTRRELLNNALTMLEWAANQRRSGYEVGAYHRDDKDLHILQLPMLMNIPMESGRRNLGDMNRSEVAESTIQSDVEPLKQAAH